MEYKILLVDDDEQIRKYYRDILVERGFKVLEASDGLNGLNMAMEQEVDLVITGIIMPKMDGFDLFNYLKKNIKTANLPVIMISHLGRKSDQAKAQGLGIKDFVIKGFITPIDLVKLIIQRIEKDETTKQYLLEIDETKRDAPKIAQDFNFASSFRCPKHPNEELVLLLVFDPQKPKEFQAKFICPQERKWG